MFGVMYGAPAGDPEVLLDAARAFSPRLERISGREVVLDLTGLTRLFGDACELADEMGRAAAARGIQVRVAIAGTRTAARLLVRHRAGVTTIAPGREAEAVAPLLLEALVHIHDAEPHDAGEARERVRIVARWGLRTLGAFAALPVEDVAARLGRAGVHLHHAARGEDPRPLVPHVPEERFEDTFDLEWPIEGLEPLSFVLGRLLDPLAAHLERRDRGAAVLRVRLHLVTRERYERALQLPFPLRDARALRTLILLDLDSHPPPAAIDRVTVAVDPMPARVVQYSLLARPLPSPEQISTLMARLQALMGETRCGSPALVDVWEPGAFAMQPFTGVSRRSVALDSSHAKADPVLALRRFRTPVAARVRVEDGRPVRVTTDVVGLAGGPVETAAGPWRTSGHWWVEGTGRVPPTGRGESGPGEGGPVPQKPRSGEGGPVPQKPRSGEGGWDHDEWDVMLADGITCRIVRARGTGAWFLEAMVD